MSYNEYDVLMSHNVTMNHNGILDVFALIDCWMFLPGVLERLVWEMMETYKINFCEEIITLTFAKCQELCGLLPFFWLE